MFASVGLPWQSGTLRTSDWYWARPDPLPFGAPSLPVGGWPRSRGLRVGLRVGRGRRHHRRQSARFRRRSKLCVEARLRILKRKVHPNERFFSSRTWLGISDLEAIIDIPMPLYYNEMILICYIYSNEVVASPKGQPLPSSQPYLC